MNKINSAVSSVPGVALTNFSFEASRVEIVFQKVREAFTVKISNMRFSNSWSEEVCKAEHAFDNFANGNLLEEIELFYPAIYAFKEAVKCDTDLNAQLLPKIKENCIDGVSFLKTAFNSETRPKIRANMSYRAGDALKEAASLEIYKQEKTRLFLEAKESFMCAGCNFKVAFDLVADDKNEKADLSSNMASAFEKASELERDKQKKGEILFQWAEALKITAKFEEDEEKKKQILSRIKYISREIRIISYMSCSSFK